MEFREEDYIIDEDSWVIVTREGWTKRQRSFSGAASIRVRDDDVVGWIYRARARQTITFFTDRGIAYTLRVNDIPLTTGHGEPIQKQFAFEDQEHIVGVVCHDPRCLPDPTRHPQTPPRFVQRLFDVDGDGDRADGESASANGHGHDNGNGSAPALPPPPYAIALTAGGKVLRFSLAPLAAISTRKGRIVARLDPTFKSDLVVGVEATDGSENVCLATRSGARAHLPRHRGQHRCRCGPRRHGHQARGQGPGDRLRAGQQEARGVDRADQPRRHPDRPGHQVPGHRPRRPRLRHPPARLARMRPARRGRAGAAARSRWARTTAEPSRRRRTGSAGFGLQLDPSSLRTEAAFSFRSPNAQALHGE